MTLGPLRFTNALGGTSDFIYPGPAIDMQSPASAGAVDGVGYLYYAQSLDMSQWERGTGAYTASSGTFARTTIAANSLGTTAKISFLNPPEIFVLQDADPTEQYYFSAYLSANTAVSVSGTPQKITCDVEIGDPSSWYSSGTFNPKVAGKYRISGHISVNATSMTELDILIYKNGSSYIASFNVSAAVTAKSLGLSAIIAFNGSTDEVELWGTAYGSGTMNFLGATAPIRTWFEAEYIGP